MRRVYIAGHRGMVGSAIFKLLSNDPEVELVFRSRSELDLVKQPDVQEFFNENKIDEVYFSAAKVGGIHANKTFPAEFIYENLMMACNVIEAAQKSEVGKLLFLGSSCIYPRLVGQPMQESSLLAAPLEPTNEAYAVAKIAGIKLCESYNRQYGTDFRSVMPTNLYGPNDNFHPENSHVIPGLIRRFHEAKLNKADEVVAWGSGKPMREFLYVDDMAEACIHLMNLDRALYDRYTQPMLSHINIGTGVDCSILELVETISDVVGFNGDIKFDSSKPDGTPRKLLNVGRLTSSGWRYKTGLKEGLAKTYDWYLMNEGRIRE